MSVVEMSNDSQAASGRKSCLARCGRNWRPARARCCYKLAARDDPAGGRWGHYRQEAVGVNAVKIAMGEIHVCHRLANRWRRARHRARRAADMPATRGADIMMARNRNAAGCRRRR